MEVADILIFGSMTQPQATDHGDLDAIILFKSKALGAYDQAEKELKTHQLDAVLRPQGSSLPSFRKALTQWLGQLLPFTSLDDQPKTVEVLLGQDPGFCCFSLLGKSWTQTELLSTTADEQADHLVQALDNGSRHSNRLTHILSHIPKLDKSLEQLQLVMAETVKPLEEALPEHTLWWKNLQTPQLGLRRSTINAAQMATPRTQHSFKKEP